MSVEIYKAAGKAIVGIFSSKAKEKKKKKAKAKAKRVKERKAHEERVINMRLGSWDAATKTADASADFGKVDEMMDFLEKSITGVEGQKGYDQARVDKMKSAIAANRQRELILRQQATAPGKSQFAFDTTLNKDNIFNK